MKHFFLGVVACLIVAALGFLIYNYVPINSPTDTKQSTEEVDSVELGFKTPQEAILFKTNMISMAHTDSVFMSMPNDVIDDVASVLIGHNGHADYYDIVSEYLTNRRIYDELSLKRRRSEDSSITNTDSTSSHNDNQKNKEQEATNRPRDSQQNDSSESEKEVYKLIKVKQ